MKPFCPTIRSSIFHIYKYREFHDVCSIQSVFIWVFIVYNISTNISLFRITYFLSVYSSIFYLNRIVYNNSTDILHLSQYLFLKHSLCCATHGPRPTG